jgi:zinc protease
MKAFRLILLFLVLASFLSAADYLQKTLPNGLKVVVKENRENNSVAFYCLINSGGENEGPYLGCGLSHYLEHVVSGGSTALHSESDYKEMEKRIGAIVNAYTTAEETAFYVQADKQFKDEALTMLAEHVMLCSFDSTEVAREKEVILKEIVMRATPPMSQASQRFMELAYPDSPKGLPVIGYTDRFRSVTREQLMDYYHAKYMPNNAVFVACGNFDGPEVMAAIEKTLSSWPRNTVRFNEQITQNPREGEYVYNEEFDLPQAFTFVNTILTPDQYRDATALDAAFDVLFGSRQAPIRYDLVEKKHWASFIYGGTDVSSDSPDGSLQVIFDVQDSTHAADILPYIDTQIAKYAQKGFKQSDIDRLIQRKRSQLMLSTPDSDTEANRIGRSMLHENKPNTDDIALTLLEKLTPADLSDVLRKYWLPKNRVVFNAMKRGTLAAAETKSIAEKADARKIVVNDQLTLLYRENREKPVVRGVLFFPLSRDYTSVDDAQAVELMIREVFSGSKKYPPLDLSDWLQDHSVSINTSFGGNGVMVSFRCLRDDFATVTDIVTDAMKNPAFSPDELQQAQQEAVSEYRHSQGWGQTKHDEFVNGHLYADQRSGLNDRAKIMQVMAQSSETLQTLFAKYFKSDNAIVTLFGDLSESEARKSAQELRDAIPRGTIAGERVADHAVIEDTTLLNDYDFEEVNVEMVTAAPTRTDADYATMSVINTLLNGSRGRLFDATRGNNADLAYYAYADYNAARADGTLHLISQTSLPNRDALVKVFNDQLDDLAKNPVSRDKLDLAIEENQKIMDSYLTDNQYPMVMTSYEASGLGYDYLARSEEILKKVTPEDIMRVAKQYFAHRTVFVSQPGDNARRTVE